MAKILKGSLETLIGAPRRGEKESTLRKIQLSKHHSRKRTQSYLSQNCFFI